MKSQLMPTLQPGLYKSSESNPQKVWRPRHGMLDFLSVCSYFSSWHVHPDSNSRSHMIKAGQVKSLRLWFCNHFPAPRSTHKLEQGTMLTGAGKHIDVWLQIRVYSFLSKKQDVSLTKSRSLRKQQPKSKDKKWEIPEDFVPF